LAGELRVDGQLINLQDSEVYLDCIPAHGPGFSLPPQTPGWALIRLRGGCQADSSRSRRAVGKPASRAGSRRVPTVIQVVV
jgi:hypothetical protein